MFGLLKYVIMYIYMNYYIKFIYLLALVWYKWNTALNNRVVFGCCVLILELRNVIMCCQKVSYVKRENEVGGELRSVKVE